MTAGPIQSLIEDVRMLQLSIGRSAAFSLLHQEISPMASISK